MKTIKKTNVSFCCYIYLLLLPAAENDVLTLYAADYWKTQLLLLLLLAPDFFLLP